jgi:hypothetical protein
MALTCENLLSRSWFKKESNFELEKLQTYNFLSFQDAFHYLIKAYNLRGKTLLVPAFYCDATIADFKKHGLNIILCPMDYGCLEIDVERYKEIVRTTKPDIIIIYNIFGKKSVLLSEKDWLHDVKPETIIISDMAHCFLVDYMPLEKLTDRHIFIDSARKTTSFMMSHLILPSNFPYKKEASDGHDIFSLLVKGIFILKTFFLKLGQTLKSKFFLKVGMNLFGLHDALIGSSLRAYIGFSYDKKHYNSINFSAIREHRKKLYSEYQKQFEPIEKKGNISLFQVSSDDQPRLCFFFLQIKNETLVSNLLDYYSQQGYWPERLWNFDAIEQLEPRARDLAKSIIVFPYTVNTDFTHIAAMANILSEFFDARN